MEEGGREGAHSEIRKFEGPGLKARRQGWRVGVGALFGCALFFLVCLLSLVCFLLFCFVFLLFLLVVWGVGGVGFASSFVLFVLFVFAVVWRFSFVVFVFVCLLFCLCVLFLSEERSRVLH